MSVQRITATRKYTLVSLGGFRGGDYLLNSNDGKTLWRISSYVEGPSTGLTQWSSDRKVWGYWKWTGKWDTKTLEEFDNWERCGSMFATRKAAIKSILEARH